MKKFPVLLLLVLIAAWAFASGADEAGDGDELDRPLWHMNQYGSPGFPTTIQDNAILQHYQQETGIEVRVELYSNFEDFNTKLQIYFASGNYPDFWHAGDEIALNTQRWQEQGVLQPVTDLLEEHGPNIGPYLFDSALDAVTIRGDVWAIPAGFNPNDPAGSPHIGGYVVREDWLENVGLDVPTTLDELHTMLVAFTTGDPDGNGRDDTFGMGMDSNLGSTNVVFNAFGVQAGHWYEVEGQLVRGELTDRYVEALAVLRDWYAEGLIDPEFPALNVSGFESRVISGSIGSFVGHVWHPHPRWRWINPMREVAPEASLMMIPAVEGPYGDRGYGPGNTLVQTNWIGANSPYGRQVVELFDWLAQGTNHLTPRIGIQGLDWEFNEARNGYNYLNDVNTDQNTKIAYGLGNGARLWPVIDRTIWRPEIEPSFEAISMHLLENRFAGAVPAMSEYPEIDRILTEATVQVILGVEPISAFEDAQQQWSDEGGSIITEQVNDFYYGK